MGLISMDITESESAMADKAFPMSFLSAAGGLVVMARYHPGCGVCLHRHLARAGPAGRLSLRPGAAGCRLYAGWRC